MVLGELKSNYTLCILGCGVMGSAITSAVLSNLEEAKKSQNTEIPLPGRILCCVKGGVDIVEKQFGNKVEIFDDNNEPAIKASDVILLSCKPFLVDKIIGDLTSIPGLLEGKIIISIVAGKTIKQLSTLTGGKNIIARVMTNTPAQISQGMAIVSLPTDIEVPKSGQKAIEWIFNQTGRSQFMDEKYMDVATALVGSGPAFCLLVMEALIDGGVRMGLPFDVAKECAAQVMAGTGQLVLAGNHPAVLRSRVCTPGGTTIGGLLVMEDNKVRSAVARAVEEATNIATSLGTKK